MNEKDYDCAKCDSDDGLACNYCENGSCFCSDEELDKKEFNMSNEPKLLPCPFCGATESSPHPVFIIEQRLFAKGNELESRRLYYVECGHCGQKGFAEKTKELALADWNTRRTTVEQTNRKEETK